MTLLPSRYHRARLLAYDTEDIYKLDPLPLSYLVEGLVVREALNLCVAREKTGKSLLALGCGLAIAKGADSYAGLRVESGRVVYIDAENGVKETHRRIRRLSEMPVPPERFRYIELGPEPFQLDHHDSLDVLEEIISSYEPDLIVLDSFRSLWSGDENRPRDVKQVLDPLRDFLRNHGVAGLLLHHANSGGDTRGTTGIAASVENITKLSRSKNGERTLVQLPSRFGEVLTQPIHFRIVPRDDSPLSPLDLLPSSKPATRTQPSEALNLGQEIMRLLADGELRSARCVARDLGLSPTNNAVHREIKRLAAHGAIAEGTKGWRLARPIAV